MGKRFKQLNPTFCISVWRKSPNRHGGEGKGI
jgi:hypothetical protein